MTDNEQDAREGLSLGRYMQHRQFLQQTLHDQARSFDKGILTLSSGALGLSLVFIERIAPHPGSWSKFILSVSWVCFAGAILSTLISFLTSQKAHQTLIVEWDATWSRQQDPETYTPDSFGVWTRRLNITSSVMFVLGVLALIGFAIANL